MAIPQADEDILAPETLAKTRIDFAERCLVNAQDLSRMMDLKASFLLSAVALMTAALGIVASKALDVKTPDTLRTLLKVAGMLSFVGYIVLAFLVVFTATQVFKALGRVSAHESLAPGLIFPLIVLERYQADGVIDEERYFDKLMRIGSNDILRDFTNQILAVSAVYQRKQSEINTSVRFFQYLCIFWIVTILLLLILLASGLFG
ncbi:MAG: hypothetical protein ACJ78Q_07995 [Chloroflexia bacterium]